jgi:hypothetical protein
MTQWQPIETAPRHYTVILLRQDQAIGEGCYRSHIGAWEFFNPQHMMLRRPTHWMPLPQVGACGELRTGGRE